MFKLSRAAHAIAITATLLVSPWALAQTSYQSVCQYVGASPREALGDAEGHAIGTAEYSCRVTSGPLANAVLSGSNIVEWKGAMGNAVAGNGSARKPGTTAVFNVVDMKVNVVMKDGKPVGVTSSGKIKYTLATGEAAAWAGKTASFTTTTTGPGQFVIDSVIE